MDRLIIGVAGNPNAGKTDVRQHLVSKHGFEGVSVSDLIRDFAHEHNIPLRNRTDFMKTYYEMEDVLGEDNITNSIVDRPANRICVDGNRVPAVDSALRSYGAKVIALWCPIEVRHSRSLGREHELDSASFEQFRRDEANEYSSDNSGKHNTLTVMQMADYHIDASQPLVIVKTQVDQIIAGLQQ